MNTPRKPDQLYSTYWHEVADLRPRWNRQVKMHCESIRGEQWYFLTCANGKNTLRFNRSAWEIIGRCDGQRTLNQIWLEAIELHHDDCATQSETIELLQQCSEKQILESTGSVAWTTIEQQDIEKKRRDFQGRFSPTGLRINCGNPSLAFEKLRPLGSFVCSNFSAVLWLTIVVWLLSTLARHSSSLAEQSTQFLLQPVSWWLMAIVFVPIKLVHELAHGLVARHFDIQSRQWGISWMFIYPAPYIDVSSANGLAEKYKRILISSAGIIAELLIAAAALFVWQHAEAGLVRQLLLATWITAGLSTIIFNANPLLKMDGYYVLTDSLQLPNLAQRSAQFWQDQVAFSKTLTTMRGETPWLFFYAPASWLWRANIFYWSFLWLGGLNRLLAYTIALAAAVQLIGRPLWNLLSRLKKSVASTSEERSIQKRFGLISASVLAVILFTPLPDRRVEKALWVVDNDYLARSNADGFVPQSFNPVKSEVSLEDPTIALQIARLGSRIQALLARQQQALYNDINLAKQINDEIELIKSEQRIAYEKLEELKLRIPANASGENTITWINPQNLPGQWVAKGQILGVARDTQKASLKLVVDQSLAGRISTESAHFFLANQQHIELGALDRQTPSALEKLPSASLSKVRGGPIETDPLDRKHLRPVNPSFAFDIRAVSNVERTKDGLVHESLTWVIVDFGYSFAAKQMLRSLQETIRTQFAVRTA